jgi:hypothetical protein
MKWQRDTNFCRSTKVKLSWFAWSWFKWLDSGCHKTEKKLSEKTEEKSMKDRIQKTKCSFENRLEEKLGLVEELSTWKFCWHELVEEMWTRWRNSVCSGLNLLKWFVNWCAENFQKTTVLNCCKWPNCAPNGHNWRGVSDKRRTNCNDLFLIQAPTLLAKTEKFAGASCGSMLGGGPENLNWWRGNCALTEPEEAKYWTGCNTPRIAWMYGI